MAQNLVELVFDYCRRIENNRTKLTVFNHLESEVKELREEVLCTILEHEGGPDGVVGEAIDIILCAIDQIYMESPDISLDEINEIATRKCEKWVRKYS